MSGSIPDIRAARWADPHASWGFVPTMGYLHAGHLALVRQARSANDRVAASIFVNPTQFDAAADLENYPRDLARDLALLEAEGVDLVFKPEPAALYPPGFQTHINVTAVSKMLEGAARPGHFAGVATVVTKLLNIVQPTRTYFGQKDAQQTIVVRRLVDDLNINTAIVVGPTVREVDGLALSSRNARLTAPQRAAAPVLYRALQAAAEAAASGSRDGDTLRRAMRITIDAEPLARIDYVSVADPETLQELDRVDGPAICSLAVYFDQIRLIDNIVLDDRRSE